MPKKPSLPASLEEFRQTGSRRPGPRQECLPVKPEEVPPISEVERDQLRAALQFVLKELCVTKVSLAGTAGVRESAIERMSSTSQRPISPEVVAAVATALNLTVDELYGLGATADPWQNRLDLIEKIHEKIGSYGLRIRRTWRNELNRRGSC